MPRKGIVLIQKTSEIQSKPLKIGIVAAPGSGKTTQAGLLQKHGFKPIVLDFENGSLSLGKLKEFGIDVPYIDITKDDLGNPLERGSPRVERLREVYTYLLTPEARANYNCIVIDTLTELANSIIASAIAEEQQKAKPDLRQAYGALSVRLMSTVYALRDMPHFDVVFLLQESLDKDETTGRRYYAPDLPGKAAQVPFQASLDSIFRLAVAEDGKRYFQTAPSANAVAKHRGSSLELFEIAEYDSGGLGRIMRQLKGLPPIEGENNG